MVNKNQTETKTDHLDEIEKTEDSSDESNGVEKNAVPEEESNPESIEETEEARLESVEEIEEKMVDQKESEDDSEDTEPPKEPTLEEQLEQSEKQIVDLQDRLLRMNAEFENYKKRMAKENMEKFKYYHMGLIKELLPALDSLEQAIEHGQKENAAVEAILEGIQMVYKLNQEALEKFSVSKIQAVGEPFDPAFHQAVGTVESETVPEDHVADQFQVGYLLHDRVVRPAMVRVSKKQ